MNIFLEKILNVLEQVRSQNFDTNADNDVHNILLVGRTGSGKSYFANALLGVLNPGSSTNVPFPAGESDDRLIFE